ncbi:hypothetical protein A6D6_01771 [Alcanivorax xiamenensis]|uniref:Uncharacterized protein n=1 Tax=Alcanivorax xiamenensis TaxID=1177156 RepID=A0ABQ6Y9E3_9GAMM|nr:hypothetical protein A6D6_01771 [Alcanivorax xiamenensis]
MKHYSKMLTGRPAHVIFLENDNPRNPLNEPVAVFARLRSFPDAPNPNRSAGQVVATAICRGFQWVPNNK